MRRPIWLSAVALAVTGLVAAGCSSSGSSSPGGSSTPTSGSSTAAASNSVFGTPKKATGTPYVFGMINDETGAVTFPEGRQGAIAAENYVNNYLGGINGHPIQIDNCTGDGTPATAARCANQLVAEHPMAILGAADVGAPASIPITISRRISSRATGPGGSASPSFPTGTCSKQSRAARPRS